MNPRHRREPIAIVGMAGRFPDAPTLEAFWHNLMAGHESLIAFSEEELVAAGVDPVVLADANYVRKGTVLEGADLFDAAFFGMSPREADGLDPQHRVFLECAWHALENAGHMTDRPALTTGVFAGASMNTYVFANLLANRAALAALGGYQFMLASDKDFLATRAAYKLDCHGPSVTVQTACSTSLVAVQLACESLRNEQCDLALAGGVSLQFPERSGYLYAEGMILSPDGHCRPFDAAASGTRGSAGVGVVALRRLRDALASRDHIHAVILGAAVNNDGARKMGYTAPSVDGQAEVIAAAHADAGVAAATITYVEAHGTGTRVGDPIELAALDQAFRGAPARRFCAIGSLKGNIGHLDAAAGVAGLMKTVLSLRHRRLPPSLNFSRLNPEIDAEHSAFVVNDTLREWAAGETPRRAGVSSFGIGGTNAHVVLEEAPPPLPSATTRRSHLLTVSARSPRALDDTARTLGESLAQGGVDLCDAAYTLHVGRRSLPIRLAAVASTIDEAAAALTRGEGAVVRGEGGSADAGVVFLFPGQGTQHRGMAADLAETEPVFAEHLRECADLLRPDLGYDIRDVLCGSVDGEAGALRMDDTAVAQPALFAMEYALARLWSSWGVRPQAMIGHSLGEYVAACLAGVFSVEDALRLVAERGRLMQAAGGEGAMLAVPLSPERVRTLDATLDVAAVNAPGMTVVSGRRDAIDRIERLLQSRGLDCRRLRTSHAFHSALMDPVLEPFRAALQRVRLNPPLVPYVSNRTGTWIRPEECTDPEYWLRHLREPVLFAAGVETLASQGRPILLEVGPGDVLATLARQAAGTAARAIVSTMPLGRGGLPASRSLMLALGHVWAAGASVEWEGVHARERLRRVPLPGYAFERQRHRVEPAHDAASARLETRARDISDWFAAPTWIRSASETRAAIASDHDGWLVFVSDTPLADGVLAELRTRGAAMWTVREGPAFARLAERSYAIDPSAPADYQRLLEAVRADGGTPAAVLHLWNVGERGSAEHAFYSPLFLVQAIGEQLAVPVRLVLAADRLHAVNADDVVDPVRALLLGAARVAPQEMPHVWTVAVDVGTAGGAQELAAVAKRLVDEPHGEDPHRVIAYRGGERWEQTFRPVRLGPAETTLRQNGVYVVTGGFGGIGLAIARYFAETARAQIVLTTRAAFPQRHEWNRLAQADGGEGETSARVRSVLDLESRGARVTVITADAADASAFRAGLQHVQATLGAIHGIVHAAGVPGDGIVQLKSRAMAAAVLAAKVDGTRVLEELIDAEGLDFIALCSSVNAIVGTAGSVDYTAANAFLDAFAAAHRARRTRVVSMNWGPWSEAGMAANAARARTPDEQRLLRAYGIRSAEGVVAFERALASGLPQVAIGTRPLPAILAEQLRREGDAHRSVITAMRASASCRTDVEDASARASAGLTPIEAGLQAIWQELLGVARPDLDHDFFALGGNSLLATSVLTRVRQRFGVSLTLRALFDAPTIRTFAACVDERRLATAVHGGPGPAITDKEAAPAEREEIEL